MKNSSKENMQYLFEQDENGAFIRLVIPATFVSTILSPEKIDDMDLRGKNNEELTTDEVIVLKKYAYELSENNKPTKLYYKQKETDIIWWVEDSETIGERLFTFDKEKIFNLFRDYPHALTSEQKEIFDKENPYWANYFKDRN